ncbi:FAD-dependent monooxygenase [Yinghuangia sp. ASG 101]|uniref:FAD-dependent monooxygenase n=1 Tax=Yinghuangia sp. ASG 101 TaxID=2896848 RepID=UPI001E46CD71|nr:FAD-dependent monooxygenase [Yinghuangia sp. ASG 101]UGQ09005.1 FAD-dependent monooxygenase [Yinghuangia sp. ASG 101]
MPTATPGTAVVVGAGIGGLAAACALHRDGWEVTVLERRLPVEPVGAGIAIAPNGLRALDTIGAGDRVRGLAAVQGAAALRRPDGRVLATTSPDAFRARFGDPMVVATRAAVLDALVAPLPAGALRAGAVVDVHPGDTDRPATVTTERGERFDADLVVAGDGIRSTVRRRVLPDQPEPRYAGFTTWRSICPPPASPLAIGETWGRGRIFGAMPLADGRVYWYATADRPAGQRLPDPRADVLDLFGDWHDPIPELIASVPSAAVLHLDAHWTATPPPALHVGRVALLGDAAHAMTPNLGQGGNQALEDAVELATVLARDGADVIGALSAYTDLRLARTSAVVRMSRRMGAMSRRRSRPAVAFRDTLLRWSARLGSDAALRPLDGIMAWRPLPRS